MSRTLKAGAPRRRPALWAAALACLALQACSQSLPDRLGAPIEGYSHTSAAINYFMVKRQWRAEHRPLRRGRQAELLREPAPQVAPRPDRGGRVGEGSDAARLRQMA
ncbi:hypothetical protein [Pseudomonas sp. MH9.2]|uniref:hypothetical protein n=1 Tax=Pseudomonas sp. MH9.2 TaxID=3048629 RepID=UPI002AC96661|nr:hypothetical protein [Pseudomonas sp. MH9.2]WPX70153.1 hypothetical protein RHM55_06145 [Pseudomonas sp. MH9.2]